MLVRQQNKDSYPHLEMFSRDMMVGSSFLLPKEFGILLVTGRSHNPAWGEFGALGGDNRCHILWGLALGDLLLSLAFILTRQLIPE